VEDSSWLARIMIAISFSLGGLGTERSY
jgi:hypothetical protein